MWLRENQCFINRPELSCMNECSEHLKYFSTRSLNSFKTPVTEQWFHCTFYEDALKSASTLWYWRAEKQTQTNHLCCQCYGSADMEDAASMPPQDIIKRLQPSQNYIFRPRLYNEAAKLHCYFALFLYCIKAWPGKACLSNQSYFSMLGGEAAW